MFHPTPSIRDASVPSHMFHPTPSIRDASVPSHMFHPTPSIRDASVPSHSKDTCTKKQEYRQGGGGPNSVPCRELSPKTIQAFQSAGIRSTLQRKRRPKTHWDNYEHPNKKKQQGDTMKLQLPNIGM